MYLDYKSQAADSTLTDVEYVFNAGATTTYTPVDPNDVVTKSYVDNLITGLSNQVSLHIGNNSVHLNSIEHNLLTGITVSATEINYLSNVTSNILNQLNNKIPLTGATLTGFLASNATPAQSLEAVTKQYVDNRVSSYNSYTLPVGGIVKTGSSITPSGFLMCNGGVVSKTTYNNLYSVIGDTYTNRSVVPGAGKPWKQQYQFNKVDNGTNLAWTTGTSLPASVTQSQAIVTNSRVYLLGGYSGGSSYLSTVYTAPINTDGTLGTWTTGTSLPGTVAFSQAIVTNSRVYLLGGTDNGNTYLSTVYAAPINTDGTLGTWTTGTSLPGAVGHSQAIVTNSRVYLLGGGGSSTVYTAPINTDGTLGSWSTGTSPPVAVGYSQAIVTNSRVYLLGGRINGSYSSTVYTAPINTDGTLGSWSTSTSLPGAVAQSQAIVTNSRVYLLGGYSGGSSYLSTVYTAPINTDGTLGSWSTSTSLPATVINSQAIVTNSRVYLLGGYISGSYSSTVYTAPFSGGLNDYLTLPNTLNTDTTTFNLPDFTYKKLLNNENFYIKT